MEVWELARFNKLEEDVGVNTPLSALPDWNNAEQLREECQARCLNGDEGKLKKCTTEKASEQFLFARCRKGSELTSQKTQGVRYCNVAIVKKDLQERGLYDEGMNEHTMRATMEVRLRLEVEWKRMKVLRRDERFLHAEEGMVKDDLERVIVDTLHAPMRVNEKVLYMLYAHAMNNKGKKKAQPVFQLMTEKIRTMGSLGEGWGPQWEDSNPNKLSSFALPYDQSKRVFNAANVDELGELVDLACGGKKEEAKVMREFMQKYVETLGLLCLNRDYVDGEVDRLGNNPP